MNKPSLSWPNRITLLRILLIVPYVRLMLQLNDEAAGPWPRRIALLLFVIMALSDGLDGYLARRLNCSTTLGRFLDPLADKLLITCSCLLLALPATAIPDLRLPLTVVVIIIGKDIYTALGFLMIYLITHGMKIVPQFAGKLSTTIQLCMVSAILLAPDILPHFGPWRYLVQGLWWSAGALALLTLIIYTRRGVRHVLEYEQKQSKHSQDPQQNGVTSE